MLILRPNDFLIDQPASYRQIFHVSCRIHSWTRQKRRRKWFRQQLTYTYAPLQLPPKVPNLMGLHSLTLGFHSLVPTLLPPPLFWTLFRVMPFHEILMTLLHLLVLEQTGLMDLVLYKSQILTGHESRLNGLTY